jgi:F0F1-type ATP synthase assembly protein I
VKRAGNGRLPAETALLGLTASAGPDYTFPPVAKEPNRGDPWKGLSTGWTITSYLIGGMLPFAGIGYLLDRLIGLRWLFLPIGMVLGVAGGIYAVYVRFGRDDGS